MDLEQFKKDALRTESLIDDVEANYMVLVELLNAFIGVGNMLDQVKKNVFYGKPFDKNRFLHNMFSANQSLQQLQYNKLDDKQKIDIDPRLFHGIIGIATEATEMVEALNTAIHGFEEVDWVNVAEENGDIAWYQSILMDDLNMNWDGVLHAVIAKLKSRYPDKFTNEEAINRDTDKERKVLEEKTQEIDVGC